MAKPRLVIPVKNGEVVDLTVENLASSGDGVSRCRGYTLFVPTGTVGDRVRARIVKTTPRFGVARVLEMRAPSPVRIQPRCAAFPRCGGCKLQHLPYEEQLRFKTRVVRDSLVRIGKLDLPDEIKIVPAENPYFYRNKAGFAVQWRSGKPRIGFYREGTHEVEDSNRCDTLQKPINEIKEHVRALLERHKVNIYDEIRHRGFFRGIVVRVSRATREALVGLVTTDGQLPEGFVENLAAGLERAKIPLAGIVQNINTRKTNIILGNANRVLWGRDYFHERLGNLDFRLSLPSFLQINTEQTIRLYDLIKEWVGAGDGTIVDAYSGIGGIALWLSESGREVVGVEEVAEAVKDAWESARLNGIDSCRFLEGSIENHIRELGGTIDALIVDPPRKGCSDEVIRAIPDLRPEKIVYVSCNPSTLARDLSRLVATGYRIADIRVVDMFPQTQHVETAVKLERLPRSA
jgi:23S rRNA (uracil1939-C5)-methyltransferase